MKIKVLLAALVLSMSPALAMAEGCFFGHATEEATMSCAQGTTWDAASASCVPVVSI